MRRGREGGERFKRMRKMGEMRKRPGWGVKGQLRRRKTSTTMAWDGAAFLVSIKVIIDRHVYNALLIFIAPH